MTKDLHIQSAGGTWVVRAGGAVIGESAQALEVTEGGYPPVIYFPREDVAMAFLDPSATRTACPRKGEAHYFTLMTAGGAIADAAWSYEDPSPAAADLAGHLAFYPDKATLERL